MSEDLMFSVCGMEKMPCNGTLVCVDTPNVLFPEFKDAVQAATDVYHMLLQEFGLTDNNATDGVGNTIPGGCVYETQDTFEATIYDFMECENDALDERAIVFVRGFEKIAFH